MNVAALIGEVASEVTADADGVRFGLAVAARGGAPPETVQVHARGGQAEACRAFLRPGHRVAVEGRVAPGASPAEVLAERVQFLTTRAEREAGRNGLEEGVSATGGPGAGAAAPTSRPPR